MAQIIKKQSAFGTHTVYYTGGSHWSDDRSKAKSFPNVDLANGEIANPDGKNGGFTGASLETK